MDIDEVKAEVGKQAVSRYVKSGMKLGLGTGSTAVWAIRRIGELLSRGSLTDIRGVATSSQSVMEAQKQRIPLRSLNDPEIAGALDLTIDGADQVDDKLRVTKGGGGALLVEKIIAYASDQVVFVVDEGKVVEQLGLSFPVPVEVVPEARVSVTRAMEDLGARVEVRMAVRKMGPVITDNGNILLDLHFDSPFDVVKMESELNLIPGVVENGLFTRCSPAVLVGRKDGTIQTRP